VIPKGDPRASMYLSAWSDRPQLTGAASGQGGLNTCFLSLDNLSIPSRGEFCKPLRNAWEQPDQNGMGLQNRVRDFNGLARKPLCYRYTIPQWIIKQFQCVVVIRCTARRNWPAAARAVLLAPSRAWQACCADVASMANPAMTLHGEWRKRSRIVMTAGAVRSVQTPAPNQWSACLSLVQGAACDYRQTI